VHALIEQNPKDLGVGGVIVNTCGWVDGVGYELLLHAIDALRADSVVAIDNEQLHQDLTRRFSVSSDSASSGVGGGGVGGGGGGPGVSVLKLSKSGGVVPRNSAFRRTARTNRIREYFYGENVESLVRIATAQRHGSSSLTRQSVIANPNVPVPLSPASTTVSFSDVVFLTVGAEPQAPLSALPLGADSTQDPLHLTEVSASSIAALLHTVAAVSFAEKPEDVLRVGTAGFVCITDINVHRQRLTCIAPVPGPLPGKFLLVGQIKWLE
jgi:polyribonucleotide 5'-hydroxyl-kinase